MRKNIIKLISNFIVSLSSFYFGYFFIGQYIGKPEITEGVITGILFIILYTSSRKSERKLMKKIWNYKKPVKKESYYETEWYKRTNGYIGKKEEKLIEIDGVPPSAKDIF